MEKVSESRKNINKDGVIYHQFEITGTAESLDYSGQYQCNMAYLPLTINKFDFPGGDLIGESRNIIVIGVLEMSSDTFAMTGQETKLSCSMKGDSQATWIRWYKEGNPEHAIVSSDLYRTKYTARTKVTSSIVTWPQSTVDLSGRYFCKGLYSAGYVESKPINLSVLETTGILEAPSNYFVLVGEKAEFLCKASMGLSYIPTILWYRMPDLVNNLENSDNVLNIETADGTDFRLSTLTFLKTTVSPEGWIIIL